CLPSPISDVWLRRTTRWRVCARLIQTSQFLGGSRGRAIKRHAVDRGSPKSGAARMNCACGNSTPILLRCKSPRLLRVVGDLPLMDEAPDLGGRCPIMAQIRHGGMVWARQTSGATELHLAIDY